MTSIASSVSATTPIREYVLPVTTNVSCKLEFTFCRNVPNQKQVINEDKIAIDLSQSTLLKVFTEHNSPLTVKMKVVFANKTSLETHPLPVKSFPSNAVMIDGKAGALKLISQIAFNKILGENHLPYPFMDYAIYAVNAPSAEADLVIAKEFQFSVFTDQPCTLSLELFRRRTCRDDLGNSLPINETRQLTKSTLVKVLTQYEPDTTLKIRLHRDNRTFKTTPELLSLVNRNIAGFAFLRNKTKIRQLSQKEFQSKTIKPPANCLLINTMNALDIDEADTSQDVLTKDIVRKRLLQGGRMLLPSSGTGKDPLFDSFYNSVMDPPKEDESGKENKEKSPVPLSSSASAPTNTATQVPSTVPATQTANTLASSQLNLAQAPTADLFPWLNGSSPRLTPENPTMPSSQNQNPAPLLTSPKSNDASRNAANNAPKDASSKERFFPSLTLTTNNSSKENAPASSSQHTEPVPFAGAGSNDNAVKNAPRNAGSNNTFPILAPVKVPLHKTKNADKSAANRTNAAI